MCDASHTHNNTHQGNETAVVDDANAIGTRVQHVQSMQCVQQRARRRRRWPSRTRTRCLSETVESDVSRLLFINASDEIVPHTRPTRRARVLQLSN